MTKQTITLDMKPRVYGNSVITPTLAVINATRTPEKLDAFAEAVSAVTATGDAQRYWDGKFIEAVTGGVVRSGYGRYRTITTTGELYRHTGMDYAINSGSDVRAINDGKVIYTGVLDYTGNIVIVEHGYGLKSWYYHLSKIDVAVGDTVSKGDVIAKSGNTGFTAFPVVYVGLSIFDFPVCQYDLWNEGIPVYIEEE